MTSTHLHVVEDPTGSVGEALERLLSREAFGFVLLATLDSTALLGSAPSLAGYRERGLTALGDQVVAHRTLLAAMLQDDSLFTGFDEVWLFASRPAIPRPAGLAITTDVSDLSDPPALEAWMRRSGAQMGLGDGLGLRIVTLSPAQPDRVP